MAAKTLVQKLKNARLLIFNSRDSQITPLLDAWGIDEAYINKGKTIYNAALQLMDEQKKEYQEKAGAYDRFLEKKDEAEVKYSRMIKVVKVITRNDENLQNRLKIFAPRSGAIESWIEQTTDFYKNLLREAKFLTILAKFKVTEEQITEEKTTVENLKVLRNEIVSEKGQAEEATRIRDEKMEQLEDYVTELKAIAEIALEGKPQLLEKLGILVRS